MFLTLQVYIVQTIAKTEIYQLLGTRAWAFGIGTIKLPGQFLAMISIYRYMQSKFVLVHIVIVL